MGRSVSSPPRAGAVAFERIDTSDWDEFDVQWEWEAIEEDAVDRIREIFPSFKPDEGWLGREDKVLASNGHAKFGMSAYGGLVSFWLVPKENGLAEAWVDRARERFFRSFGTLRRLGFMSNGEAVFERIEA